MLNTQVILTIYALRTLKTQVILSIYALKTLKTQVILFIYALRILSLMYSKFSLFKTMSCKQFKKNVLEEIWQEISHGRQPFEFSKWYNCNVSNNNVVRAGYKDIFFFIKMVWFILVSKITFLLYRYPCHLGDISFISL